MGPIGSMGIPNIDSSLVTTCLASRRRIVGCYKLYVLLELKSRLDGCDDVVLCGDLCIASASTCCSVAVTCLKSCDTKSGRFRDARHIEIAKL